jgi:hypothetical protein
LPRQNRVTPFGELIAIEARGTLMGNRGCLHDERQCIRRPFACRRWICCVLQFRGRRRAILAPGRYTELFFLDEATALAAGHRPCAECQRARYLLFRTHWAAAHAGAPPGADDIDRVLHAERLDGDRRKRTFRERLSRLPSGVMVADENGDAALVLGRGLAPWSAGGYGPPIPAAADAEVAVLTPPSVVRVITQGYPVGLYPSAAQVGRPVS